MFFTECVQISAKTNEYYVRIIVKRKFDEFSIQFHKILQIVVTESHKIIHFVQHLII